MYEHDAKMFLEQASFDPLQKDKEDADAKLSHIIAAVKTQLFPENGEPAFKLLQGCRFVELRG